MSRMTLRSATKRATPTHHCCCNESPPKVRRQSAPPKKDTKPPQSELSKNATSKSESATLRDQGNLAYKQYLSSYTKEAKRMNLFKAQDLYDDAVKKADDNDNASKAFAHKNIAMTFTALATIEKGNQTRLYFLRQGVEHRANALTQAQLANFENQWMTSMCNGMKTNIEEFLKNSSTLLEKTLEEILSLAECDVQLQEYRMMMANYRLDQAERYLTKGMEAIGNRDFKRALPLLHELYRPVEEGKRRCKDCEDLQHEFEILEQDYNTFLAIGCSLQEYNYGVEILERALTAEDDNERFQGGIVCVDHFKMAEVLARGEEVEVIAMVQVKIGIAQLKLFGSKYKAKQCFMEAMNLSSTLIGALYNRPWYVEVTTLMQEIRSEEERLEQERWENKRKPFLEQLDKELKLLWSYQHKSTQQLIDFLFEQFPPKHVKDVKKPVIEQSEKKAMLKLCQMYHPDKLDKNEHETKYIVLCEEITKLINNKYGCMKMAD